MGKGYDNEKGGPKFGKNAQDQGEPPEVGVQLILNAGNPETVFSSGQLPNAKAPLNYETLDGGCSCPKEFYINKIMKGLATLVASVYPKRIILRLSDFKSNEYSSLIGGEQCEPYEENPMMGSEALAATRNTSSRRPSPWS